MKHLYNRDPRGNRLASERGKPGSHGASVPLAGYVERPWAGATWFMPGTTDNPWPGSVSRYLGREGFGFELSAQPAYVHPELTGRSRTRALQHLGQQLPLRLQCIEVRINPKHH